MKSCAIDIHHHYVPESLLEEAKKRGQHLGVSLTEKDGNRSLSFAGGPPFMLHPELPAMIELVVKRGYIPRLVTNGSRLLKTGYLQELYSAGLRWIILQFDGFSDDIHQKLRKRNLMEMKPRVIKAINEAGIRLQFATMVKRDTNLDQDETEVHLNPRNGPPPDYAPG